jgi:hypothetical protein
MCGIEKKNQTREAERIVEDGALGWIGWGQGDVDQRLHSFNWTGE